MPASDKFICEVRIWEYMQHAYGNILVSHMVICAPRIWEYVRLAYGHIRNAHMPICEAQKQPLSGLTGQLLRSWLITGGIYGFPLGKNMS